MSTYEQAVAYSFPDDPGVTLTFTPLDSILINAAGEIIPKTARTALTTAGTIDLPVPDGTGRGAWRWSVSLPDAELGVFELGHHAGTAQLATLLATYNERTAVSPNVLAQLIARYGLTTAQDTWLGAGITAVPDGADLIPDAPADGSQYARQDGDWAAISAVSDVSDLTTAGLTAANMLRVASGGGVEERTPAQVLADIGAETAGSAAAAIGFADLVSVTSSRVLIASDSGKVLEVADVLTIDCPADLGTGFRVWLVPLANTIHVTAAAGTLQYISDGVQSARMLIVERPCMVYHRGGGVWMALDADDIKNYLIFTDDFLTSLSAGIVNGTAAESGPGLRTVVDTTNLVSITGGQLVKTGVGPGAHDPILQYQSGVTRAVGQLLCGEVMGIGSIEDLFWGYSASLNVRPTATAFNFQISATALRLYYNASLVAVSSYTATGNYSLAVALRSSGAFYFIRGTEYDEWELLGWNTAGTQTILYAGIGGASSQYQSDYISAPVEKWLPTPLVSDGFSATASDGLGHAETTGIGAGGSGVVWVAAIGTWGVAAGQRAASALVGGIAINICDVGTADVIFETALTRSAGSVGIVARFIDSNNYLYAYHDGTSVTLRQVVGGISSELIAPTVASYSAGRILRIQIKGSTARVYYNLVAIGGAVTVDSTLLSATNVGLYTSSIANTFDNALAYSLGVAGEYAALKRYFPQRLTSTTIFTIGDSKSVGTYQPYLITDLISTTGGPVGETSPRFAVSGYTTADMAGYAATNLGASYGPNPDYILINLGANDVISMPVEATWKVNYGSIIDACHAKWPNAAIYCMRVWRRGYGANCDTLATWLADVLATRSAFAYVGPDERVWLENGDDGVTYTSDGVHYNTAGKILAAEKWNELI